MQCATRFRLKIAIGIWGFSGKVIPSVLIRIFEISFHYIKGYTIYININMYRMTVVIQGWRGLLI